MTIPMALALAWAAGRADPAQEPVPVQTTCWWQEGAAQQGGIERCGKLPHFAVARRFFEEDNSAQAYCAIFGARNSHVIFCVGPDGKAVYPKMARGPADGEPFCVARACRFLGKPWGTPTFEVRGKERITGVMLSRYALKVTLGGAPAGGSLKVDLSVVDPGGETKKDFRGDVEVRVLVYGSEPSISTLAFTEADAGRRVLEHPLPSEAGACVWVAAFAKDRSACPGVGGPLLTEPGTPERLEVAAPKRVPANGFYHVVVRALDRFGNLATGFLHQRRDVTLRVPGDAPVNVPWHLFADQACATVLYLPAPKADAFRVSARACGDPELTGESGEIQVVDPPPRYPNDRVAIFREKDFPADGPVREVEWYGDTLSQAGFKVTYVGFRGLMDRAFLTRENFDLLLLPYGSYVPTEAVACMDYFVGMGGAVFYTKTLVPQDHRERSYWLEGVLWDPAERAWKKPESSHFNEGVTYQFSWECFNIPVEKYVRNRKDLPQKPAETVIVRNEKLASLLGALPERMKPVPSFGVFELTWGVQTGGSWTAGCMFSPSEPEFRGNQIVPLYLAREPASGRSVAVDAVLIRHHSARSNGSTIVSLGQFGGQLLNSEDGKRNLVTLVKLCFAALPGEESASHTLTKAALRHQLVRLQPLYQEAELLANEVGLAAAYRGEPAPASIAAFRNLMGRVECVFDRAYPVYHAPRTLGEQAPREAERVVAELRNVVGPLSKELAELICVLRREYERLAKPPAPVPVVNRMGGLWAGTTVDAPSDMVSALGLEHFGWKAYAGLRWSDVVFPCLRGADVAGRMRRLFGLRHKPVLWTDIGIRPIGPDGHPKSPYYAGLMADEADRERQRAYFSKEVAKYDTGAVSHVDSNNESTLWYGSGGLDQRWRFPGEIRLYRNWLRKRYATIHALNRTWETEYPSFEAVELPEHYPRTRPERANWEDWTSFRDHTVSEYYRIMYESLKASKPDLLLNSRSYTRRNPLEGFDFHLVGRWHDFEGDHQLEIYQDWVAELARKPGLNSEWHGFVMHPLPDHVAQRLIRRCLWHNAANNHRGWDFFSWSGYWGDRPTKFVESDALPRLPYWELKCFLERSKRWHHIVLDGSRPPAQLAFYFSRCTERHRIDLASGFKKWREQHEGVSEFDLGLEGPETLAPNDQWVELDGWDLMLRDGKYLREVLVDQDFLGETTVRPARFKAIVAPHQTYLPRDAIAGLLRYVEEGGNLIVIGPTGKFSAHGGEDGRIFAAARVTATRSKLTDKKGILQAHAYETTAWGADFMCLEPTGKDVEVLVKFADGSPAVTASKAGKGSIFVLGIPIGTDYVRKTCIGWKDGWSLYHHRRVDLRQHPELAAKGAVFVSKPNTGVVREELEGNAEESGTTSTCRRILRDILARCGIQPLARCAERDVEIKPWSYKGRTYWFVVNTEDRWGRSAAIAMAGKWNVRDYLLGLDVPVKIDAGETRFEIELLPGEGRIYEIQP